MKIPDFSASQLGKDGKNPETRPIGLSVICKEKKLIFLSGGNY